MNLEDEQSRTRISLSERAKTEGWLLLEAVLNKAMTRRGFLVVSGTTALGAGLILALNQEKAINKFVTGLAASSDPTPTPYPPLPPINEYSPTKNSLFSSNVELTLYPAKGVNNPTIAGSKAPTEETLLNITVKNNSSAAEIWVNMTDLATRAAVLDRLPADGVAVTIISERLAAPDLLRIDSESIAQVSGLKNKFEDGFSESYQQLLSKSDRPLWYLPVVISLPNAIMTAYTLMPPESDIRNDNFALNVGFKLTEAWLNELWEVLSRFAFLGLDRQTDRRKPLKLDTDSTQQLFAKPPFRIGYVDHDWLKNLYTGVKG